MKNLIVVFALLTASSVFAFGQNAAEKTSVCTNEAVQKISSRGIKIGADINDVLNLFASTEEEKQQLRNNGTGERARDRKIGFDFFSVRPKPNSERFTGVSNYSFDFLDGKIVNFSVSYDKPKWKDTKQFAEKIAKSFDLPNVENWKVEQANGIINLQCGNYSLFVQTYNIGSENSQSYLGVSDNRTRQILEQRKQKAEDEKREKDIKAFKP